MLAASLVKGASTAHRSGMATLSGFDDDGADNDNSLAFSYLSIITSGLVLRWINSPPGVQDGEPLNGMFVTPVLPSPSLHFLPFLTPFSSSSQPLQYAGREAFPQDNQAFHGGRFDMGTYTWPDVSAPIR